MSLTKSDDPPRQLSNNNTVMRKLGGSSLVAAAFLFCLQTPMVIFAQPTNIDCTNAIVMSLDTVYSFNTADAGSPGDPTNICSSPFGKGVWFSLRAPRDGILTLSTCGSDFDTVIGIYTGDCGSLNFYSCADDNGPSCPGVQASCSFPVTQNTMFYFVVGGYDGASGNLQFTASISPPPNDQCPGAIALTNSVPYLMDTVGATGSNAPPSGPCDPYYAGYGVWFSYIPTNTDLVTISTAGSDMGTVVEVFTGDCGNLSQVTCGQGPTLHFQATNGITYLLFVTGYRQTYYSSHPSTGILQILAVEGSLPNDFCSGAIPLADGVPCFTNTLRATSTGDPIALNGIWYTYTPESNGVVTVSTCGSDFSTALQVYTGSCNSLSAQPGGSSSGNGPACPSNASVSFQATRGVTYYILAGGAAGAIGNLEIQATLSPSLNDLCQNAIPMQEGIVYTRNTVAATTNGDPSSSCSYLGNSVWYTFTPSSNGVVTVSTCGSDFPTALRVYSGSCGSLSPLLPDGCNSGGGPACASNQASVSFQGVGGTTYYVMAGSSGQLAGNLQIQATLSPSLNDQCANAIPMQDGILYTRNTAASTSAGDPNSYCTYNFGKGVWYTYTPASNGVLIVSTCGSDFDTALQVYSGRCGALSLINNGLDACNDNYGPACPTIQASLAFEAAAGTTYYILAGGNNAATGNLQIKATLVPPLPNDHCSGAIALTNGVTYAENTATATSVGDPINWYDSKGVWFSFTPATNGVVTVSTCGSDYPTELETFTGGCSSLTQIPDGNNGGNGPLCSGSEASVVFPGTAGTTYLIYVAANGYGFFGNLQIQATLQPSLPNDQCSGAINMTEGVTYTIDTTTATSVGDVNPTCGGIVRGVWYQYTPLATNLITINAEATNFTPTLLLCTGTCSQLTTISCNYNYRSSFASLSFNGVVGKTYLIQVGGEGESSGILNITAGALPPLNDQCSGAVPMLPGLKYTVNTAYATSTNDPLPACDATADHGVWYRYTPQTDAQVTVETCDSDFDTVLQVYSGGCSSLTPVACDDGSGPSCATNRASVSFFGQTGTNYYILVAGKNGAFGNLSISADGPPPANDTCDTAITMAQDVVYRTNTTYASSTGDTFPVEKGVWYQFTPSRPGLLLLSTCGSDYQTAFNVYTGACGLLTYYNGSSSDSMRVCESNQASAEFLVSSGTTYYIDVGGFLGASGNLSIMATMPPPANDTCAGAIALTNGVPYQMNTANATEAGDPTPLCQTNFGKGVWFTFTPDMSGTISLSTCNGDLDSVLQVYTGSCGALTPMADSCNDDAGPDCNSFSASVHFQGEAGVTYWILVGGYGGAGGNLVIEGNILPVLGIERVGTNSVLYWPSNFIGYRPQVATNLAPPILWNSVTGTTAFQDTNFCITNSTPGNSIFYRLKK